MADIKPLESSPKFELEPALDNIDAPIEKTIKPELAAKEKSRFKPMLAPTKTKSEDLEKLSIKKDIGNLTAKVVEDILAEDLDDLYSKLPENKKNEFKSKGEQTANQIATLFNQVKYKVSEILELIKNWLKIIPGVSKFFLEQEAKIKTDKIIKYNQNKR